MRKKRTYLVEIFACVLVMATMVACLPDRAAVQKGKETTVNETKVTTAGQAESASESEEKQLAFSTKTMQGDTFDNSMFEQYDITMVNVWATYCDPCIREMPDLETLHKSLPANMNIIGVVSDVTDVESEFNKVNKDVGQTIIDDNKVTFQNLILNQGVYDFLKPLRITAVPTTFFVDKNGQVVGDILKGVHEAEQYRKAMDKAASLLEG